MQPAEKAGSAGPGISGFSSATVFHTPAWSQVLRDAYGYRPYTIALGSADAPRGYLPLLEIDSWLTGRRGVALPFTDECPPLARDPSEVAELHARALAAATQRRWRYLEIRGSLPAAVAPVAATRFLGHSLSLLPVEEELFAACSSAARRAVRKAEQSELRMEVETSLGALRQFYHLATLTRRRHGVPPQPFSFYRAIHQHLIAARCGVIVLARHNGRAVAGAVFLHHGQHAVFKFGASDERLQHLRANNLVMWRAIQWHRQHGFEQLDFGRTSLSNEGLRAFKLGWGAQERDITYHRYHLASRRFVEVPDESTGRHAALFQRLPLPLARLAGKLLYRHVG